MFKSQDIFFDPFTQDKKRDRLISTPIEVDMGDLSQVTDFQGQLQKYHADVERVVLYARECAIETEDDSAFNVEEAGKWRKLLKRIDATRKEITDPAREFVSKVNTLAKSYTDKLDEAIRIIATKDGAYKAKQIAALEAKLAAERVLDEMFGETTVSVAPEIKRNTDTSTCSTYQTTEWDIQIEDLAKVPTEFLMLDESAVKYAVKKGRLDIAGLKITEKKVTRIRTK